MGMVYVLDADGNSRPMNTVLCKDEDKELQCVLAKNLDLLPGDQIDPDSPCRWMLVKREMAVPDPGTGSGRWYIDFFLVDQNATPTFVECKRYLDTRSRREVVGQVFEYVANGQQYWSATDIRALAEASAKESSCSLEDAFRRLQSGVADSPDTFFNEVERRLRAGEVRVVFFLEQAPVELKRLVEFLNTQMSSMDVLLVEARQYRSEGIRVVVPTLFGFTERIREIKRAQATERNKKAIAVDWDSFSSNAEQKGLDPQSIESIKRLYEACKSLKAEIAWGRGAVTGSFSPKWAAVNPNTAPFSVYADGKLELHLSSFQGNEASKRFADTLAQEMISGGLSLPPDCTSGWFAVTPAQWIPKTDLVILALDHAVARLRNPAAAD
jgi:hypothetical protein